MCIQCPSTGTVFNLSSSTDKFRNRVVHTLSIHFFNPLWLWILSLLFPLKQVWQRPFVTVMKYNGLLKITLVLVLPPAFCNIDLSSFLEVWSWFLLPSMLLVCLPFSCHSVIVYGVSFLTIVFSQCSDQVIPLLTLYAYLEKYYPNLLLPGINVSGMCVSSPRFLSAL